MSMTLIYNNIVVSAGGCAFSAATCIVHMGCQGQLIL